MNHQDQRIPSPQQIAMQLRQSRQIFGARWWERANTTQPCLRVTLAIETKSLKEIQAAGENVIIRYSSAQSPFGRCLVATIKHGIAAIKFSDGGEDELVRGLHTRFPKALLQRDTTTAAPIIDILFADTDTATFKPYAMKLCLCGTPFQLSVWKALLNIPTGHLFSYGDIARAIGRPVAARAVGNAVGENPIAYVVPCHRVIRESGAIGGYGSGVPRKLAFLGKELATVLSVGK